MCVNIHIITEHVFISFIFFFQDVFILVTPVVEYDREREKELDRARKRQTLAYLFPEPTPMDDAQDRNSVWGQSGAKGKVAVCDAAMFCCCQIATFYAMLYMINVIGSPLFFRHALQ